MDGLNEALQLPAGTLQLIAAALLAIGGSIGCIGAWRHRRLAYTEDWATLFVLTGLGVTMLVAGTGILALLTGNNNQIMGYNQTSASEVIIYYMIVLPLVGWLFAWTISTPGEQRAPILA